MSRLGAMALLGLAVGCGGELRHSDDDGSAGGAPADAGVPFAVEVVSVSYGPGAGFGQQQFPGVVLGPPVGGGESKGSLDVLTLGKGGSITLRLGADAVDGPGTDLLVFENAFRQSGGNIFWSEPAEVAVSADGVTFAAFPCLDVEPFTGCAGLRPVYAPGADGTVSPVDPAAAGGDAYDLSDVGLARARFVRVTDRSTDDPFPNTAGFDLDAVASVPHH